MEGSTAASRFPHEKLSVWQDARALVKSVYSTTKTFPKSEAFGLISQLNRAIVSVACNLAEGSARTSPRDQAHFSQLAYSSLMEVSCLITLCSDLDLIACDTQQQMQNEIGILSARIHKLRQAQINRITKP